MSIQFPRKTLDDFCRRYRVRQLSLFGSALGDHFRSDSDVDILVVFDSTAKITFLTLGRMKRELSEMIGRPVDLVLQDGLKPVIRETIISSAKIIYAS